MGHPLALVPLLIPHLWDGRYLLHTIYFNVADALEYLPRVNNSDIEIIY